MRFAVKKGGHGQIGLVRGRSTKVNARARSARYVLVAMLVCIASMCTGLGCRSGGTLGGHEWARHENTGAHAATQGTGRCRSKMDGEGLRQYFGSGKIKWRVKSVSEP